MLTDRLPSNPLTGTFCILSLVIKQLVCLCNFLSTYFEKRFTFCSGRQSVALIYLLSQTALGLCDSWRSLPSFICEMLNIQRSVLSCSHLWHHWRNPSRREAAFTFPLCHMSQLFWMMVSDWCLEITSRVMWVWMILAHRTVTPQYTAGASVIWWFLWMFFVLVTTRGMLLMFCSFDGVLSCVSKYQMYLNSSIKINGVYFKKDNKGSILKLNIG